MVSIAQSTHGTIAGFHRNTLRHWSLPALWLALAFQVVWMTGIVFPEPKDGELGVFDFVVVTICGTVVITSARVPWLAAIARIWIGVMLVGSVADRFGLLGEPGAAGVSWGNWSNFVDYTRDITTFLPGSMAPVLALTATVAEIVLGLGLMLGVRTSSMALGTAALLVVYGLSMSVSLGPESTFPYNVWVLCMASIVLVWSEASPISIDRLRRRASARGGM